MEFVVFFFVAFCSFAIGVFGFAQIIGSIRTRQKHFVFPILIWLAILVGEYFLAKGIAEDYMAAFYIGSGISLLIILRQKMFY